jgi:uncharacterized protein YdiU (UPF0061 family)
MKETMSMLSNVGWQFDNSYTRLPELMMSRVKPVKVQSPKLIVLNHKLSKELGLNFKSLKDVDIASLFAGNILPKGSETIAQAYAGHQFGHFTMLGDGRAHVLGEHLTPNNKRFDIQFKGSGRTPYSRGGDGKAVLGPMLREYIISESMNALNISTTRSLAVVTTGENIMRETSLPGAILTRVASSHIRVGTFQYIAMKNEIETLKNLVNYVVNRHYPELIKVNNQAIELLKVVIDTQINLVVDWMRVGFIHGVMNTDNMAISGETIDYGPCAFMDNYDPRTVFSSIDHQGRYCFINQSLIAHWNISRFAETLIPLLDNNEKKAITIGEEIINSFNKKFQSQWLSMMRQKLGLFGEKNNDENLVNNLLSLMHQNNVDYTNTFGDLMKDKLPNNSFYKLQKFSDWFKEWKNRQSQNRNPKELSLSLMRSANPYVIPRNHKVEEVLTAASGSGNFEPMNKLLKELNKPYDYRDDANEYRELPKTSNIQYQTFCGT